MFFSVLFVSFIHLKKNFSIIHVFFTCISVQRQMGRFSGFSLYVSNTTERHSGYLCYKNGPDLGLPPLDFNTNCIVHGRYVIFYNERLPGTQYPIGFSTHGVITELCEVTVTGILSNPIIRCEYTNEIISLSIK